MAERRFDGRAALVTGAANGLGLAYATALARRGARVVLNDIAHDADGALMAERVAARLRAEGLDAIGIGGDISVEAEARGLVRATIGAFGQIDILINNAGGGGAGTLQDTDGETFARYLASNLFGVFWTMQEAIGPMRANDYGRIVNTSSAVGVFGGRGALTYATAKSGVVGLTRSASLDNRDRNIRINAIAPVAYTQLAKAWFDAHPQVDPASLDPAWAAPVALVLAHEDCAVHGEVLAAGGRRAARLFTAATPGFSSRDLDLDQLADNFDAVMDTADFRILESSIEQYDMLPDFS